MSPNKEVLRLSQEKFLKSFENVPRFAVNLIITNEEGEVLLTRRNIPPDEESWHFPGGFVLKNEPHLDALRRVASDELGLVLDENTALTLLGIFDDLDGDPRGHVIDAAFGLQVSNISSQLKTIEKTRGTLEIGFFTAGKLPKDIGFNHRDTLNRLGY